MISHPIESETPYTALVLNYKLPKFFPKLWNNAKTRICADGGANRIYQYSQDNNIEIIYPDFVVGDLDSLKPQIETYYKPMGTKFIKIFDQNQCDIEKSLSVIKQNGFKEPVVIFGALGGRFDHTISSLHSVLEFPELRTFFLDDENFLTWIFPKDKGIVCHQKWTTKICGLLPICQPVEHISTKGLKWDVDASLKMGKFISSSNEIKEGVVNVEIETTNPILWQNQTKNYNDLPL